MNYLNSLSDSELILLSQQIGVEDFVIFFDNELANKDELVSVIYSSLNRENWDE